MVIEADDLGAEAGQPLTRRGKRAFVTGVLGIEEMVDGVRRLPDDKAQEQQCGEEATDDGHRANGVHGGARIPAPQSGINSRG